ncbi:GAF domain-containing protein [Brasilonema sp. CT11]|nr:GAF domain-containing protein [Brasilonema sp. CT11]
MQVRAELIVPILLAQDLWGLLIAQQCHQPRQWQQTEIDLLQQLADQLGIAIQLAELHKQIECLKVQQQLQSQKQTSELQYFLKFEPVVRALRNKSVTI